MLINLSDVLASEGRQTVREIPLEMTCFKSKTGSYEIISKSPVSFTFTNIGTNKAKIKGKVRCKLKACCDRCLTEVPVDLQLDFVRTVTVPGTVTVAGTVTAPGVEITDEEADDMGFMDGYEMDTEALVYDEIVVNWPVKILCKDDCKGLCPKCGQNLNMGDCGCDTFVPDPRMAAIQDIFNANKEV